jgi:hypothetical protein
MEHAKAAIASDNKRYTAIFPKKGLNYFIAHSMGNEIIMLLS